MTDSITTKRVVVGAHYGLRDWLAQRITAALMALFTLLVLVQVIFTRDEIGYDLWAGIFNPQWMRALTFTATTMSWGDGPATRDLGSGLYAIALQGRALYNTTDSGPCKIVVQNTQSTY